MSRRSLEITVAVALGTLAGGTPVAHAQVDCSLPPPSIVWSYPADGDTNVPTNAMIWILTSRGRQPQRVLLDGDSLDVSPRDFSFVPLQPMSPNAQHTIVILPPGAPAQFIRFRTADGPAPTTGPDRPLVHWITARGSRTLSPKCQAIVKAMGCFNGGEDTHVVVAVEGTPLLWLIERVSLIGLPAELHPWPAECGLPELFVPRVEGRICGRGIRLHAIDATGRRSMTDPFCVAPLLKTAPPDVDAGAPTDDAGVPADAGDTTDATFLPLLLGESSEASPDENLRSPSPATAGQPVRGVISKGRRPGAMACNYSTTPSSSVFELLTGLGLVAWALRRRRRVR
jgi:hypothetical protein